VIGATVATATRTPPSVRTVSRPARPRGPIATTVQPAPTDRLLETGLDTVVERWWTALAAGESAVRAAQRMPGGRGLFDGDRRPVAERAEVIRLLVQLEHELHEHSRLLPWLSRSRITNRMLGLPSTVHACVFDLDGVLTTSADVHAAAWAETLDRFLLEQAHVQRRPYIPFQTGSDYEILAGRPRLEGVRAFLVSRGMSLPEGSSADPPGTPTVHGVANRKNQLLQWRLQREGVDAFSGSRVYLEALRMAGLARAVVSPSASTGAILRQTGLKPLVDVRVDGPVMEKEHLRAKPAPDTLLVACRLLGVDPHETAAFETAPAGVAAARAAGIGFVVAANGEKDVLRASEADLVVGGLSDLLGLDRG
jgi:HAD superfamily hydrolase (TIGR01509 family)